MVFQGENSLSETLLERINDNGQVYMIPSKLRDMYVIRFAVCSRYTELCDIDIQASCQEIRRHSSNVITE
jgi:aromatic-L-amino-acid decarboxylase